MKTKTKELPDPYAMELNTERIKAYRELHKQFNVDESAIMHIFNAGIDWYKEQLEENKK